MILSWDSCTKLSAVLIFACATCTLANGNHTVSKCLTRNPGNESDITIGFLSSFLYGGGMAKLIAGAVPLAVEDVNSRQDLLPNHKLKFLVGDTGQPDTATAIRKMSDMRDNGAVAFIGPDHSCASEALVAAAWRLPMIAFKCADRKVSDKQVFSTFARTLPPSSKISKSLVALLLYYKWLKIVLVVSRNPTDIQVEEALVSLTKKNDIVITGTYYIPGDYVSTYKHNLTSIVDNTYDRTRVYVLLADDYALVDLVRYMYGHPQLDIGEYVVILVEEEQLHDPKNDWRFLRKEIEAHTEKKYDLSPFRSVLLLTSTYRIGVDWQSFQQKVLNYSSMPPFSIPFHPEILVTVPIHAGMLYDAILIYSRAVTEVLQENKSVTDGEAVFSKIRSRSYSSIFGYSVRIDENGDAEGHYTLLALQSSSAILDTWDTDSSQLTGQSIQPVGFFTQEGDQDLPNLKLNKTRPIQWVGGKPPLQEPKCGFDNEHCVYKPDWRIILVCSVCIIILITAASFALRHYRYEHKLACLLWKIEMKDVILLNSDYIKHAKNIQGVDTSKFSRLPASQEDDYKHSKKILGVYKGNVVFVKPIYKRSIDITRSLRKEMIQIREMRQENINPFIGACVDPPNICILSLFCSRGSLKDILKNSDINLDTVFVASLVADLIKGMTYIHDSEIVSHGNLKSSNCLVDSRWVLQITDFGLHEFKDAQELPQQQQLKCVKGLLWTAPELLRDMNPPARGSQKGDVYSFGIILHEILARKGPWGPTNMTYKCILKRILNPFENGGKPFRPPMQDIASPEYAIRCMEECWDENPEQRPDFRLVNVKLREMLSEVKTNIFDNMIAIMEKYASNLEGLVQERTHLLMEEKKKTENLLLRMLPKPVAEQLKRGEQVEAESFDCVTIYFSDIVGFTALSALSTPLEVVDLLNDLYTCFDSIIGHYDVYKVETIGDAYMVVSGLPIPNGNNHAAEIASMALHLLSAIRNFEIRHRPSERLKLRIGIHSGPCVAGVVGLKMPRYCLFGDTVNTASRMESTGEALKIHISPSCEQILRNLGGFLIEERGVTQVKGKGEMRTFWLVGQQPKPSETTPMLIPPSIIIESGGSPELKARRYTDSRLLVRESPLNCSLPSHNIRHSTLNAITTLSKDLNIHLLNTSHGNYSVIKKSHVSNPVVTYSSCRNLLQECTRTLSNMKQEFPCESAYCSAPSIAEKQFSVDNAIA